MRKSMLILLLAWWLVAPAWGAELPREVRDALPAAAEEITEELEDPASLSEGLSRLWDRALGYVEEAVRQSIGGGVVLLAAAVLCALTEECMDAAGGKVHFVPMAGALAICHGVLFRAVFDDGLDDIRYIPDLVLAYNRGRCFLHGCFHRNKSPFHGKRNNYKRE